MLKNGLCLFIIAVALLMIFIPSYTKMQDLKRQTQEYQREIEALKAKQARMEEEKQLLLEDPVYLEKVAREKMGLIKEGEVIYKITPVEAE